MSEETQNGQVEEVVTPQGEEQQPVEMPTTEEPSNELPDDASERTKQQFAKLKEHNKKLKEELDAAKGGTQRPPSLLESYVLHQPTAPVATPNLSQTQVAEITKQVVDAEGYLDQGELEARLRKADEAERRASQAEQRANQALERVARFEVDAQTKELYREFPQLDPSKVDIFDPKAYNLVKKELLSQLVEGQPQNAILAARNVSEYFDKKEVTPAQQQTLAQRQQATAHPVSGNASSSKVDFDDLRRRSMTSQEAMDERIRRAGI